MMKSLLILMMILFAGATNAQVLVADIDDFYPKLKSFKLKGDNHFTPVRAGGCVSGDCKNGDGVYIYAFSYARVSSTDIGSDTFKLRRYKGRFSNDGAQFDGTVAEEKFHYDFTSKKSTLRFDPRESMDMSDNSNWTAMLTGRMPRIPTEVASYKVQGWRPAVNMAATAGMPKRVLAYYEGYLSYARIEYMAGGALSTFNGKISMAGDPLCGRLDFSDGSSYEGFIYHGKFFGPGRHTTAAGVREGIWKMDTLIETAKFNFPRAISEPRPESEEMTANYHVGEYRRFPARPRYFAAGTGRAFAYDSLNVIFGEVKDNGFNGKGSWINFEPGAMKGTNTAYRTGLLKDGELKDGFRMRDYLGCTDAASGWGMSQSCTSYRSALAEGKFSYDQLEGCSRKILYAANGVPNELQEGYFEGDGNADDAPTGWVYINDWTGLRSKDKLQFYYKGRDVMRTNNSSDYGYATYFLDKNQFCFPSMEFQGQAIKTKVYKLVDSMNVIFAKNRADAEREAERKRLDREAAAAAKTRMLTACADKLKTFAMTIGSTVTHNDFTGIIQEVDCEKQQLTVVRPGGRSSLNSGVYSETVPLSQLFVWHVSNKQFKICNVCKGLGGESVTVTTSKTKELPFGYFSGIETKVTHYKTQTYWDACNRCSGQGVLLE